MLNSNGGGIFRSITLVHATGIPAGGTTGQALLKQSNADYDVI